MSNKSVLDQALNASGGFWPFAEEICRAKKSVVTRDEFYDRKAERQCKPIWNDAPTWAQWLAQDSSGCWAWHGIKPTASNTCWESPRVQFPGSVGEVIGLWIDTLEKRPNHIGDITEKDWPNEDRIDPIGQNGNEGLHYQSAPKSAADFLSDGLAILTERGNQYGSEGRECSFPQVAQAFTAITGKPLVGSDVCLILALVKQVRQYAQPDRFHQDSAVDGVNYTALQAEQLKRERLSK